MALKVMLEQQQAEVKDRHMALAYVHQNSWLASPANHSAGRCLLGAGGGGGGANFTAACPDCICACSSSVILCWNCRVRCPRHWLSRSR